MGIRARRALAVALLAATSCGPSGEGPCEPSSIPPCLRLARIRADIDFLAAPRWKGRLAGTEGNEAAVAHVEAAFASLGLEPAGDDGGYRQWFDFDLHQLSAHPTLALGVDALAYPGDFYVAAHAGSGALEGPVVFAGYGITVPAFDAAVYPDCPLSSAGYDDYGQIDVAGKIVVVLRHGPHEDVRVSTACPGWSGPCEAPACHWTFSDKALNAARHGAAAMLLVQDYHHGAAPPFGVSVGPATYREYPGFPTLFVDRDRLEARLPELRTWATEIDLGSRPGSRRTGISAQLSVAATVETRPVANVLGSVPGTDPTVAHEVVVVGAHLDHLGALPLTEMIFPGANDNASGVAVLLELARALASSRGRARRTVLFAAFNAEEEGLLGSRYYVDVRPAYALANTIAMINLDMVGTGDGSGLFVYGGSEPRSRWLALLMNAAAANRALTARGTALGDLYLSDHAPFARAGIPAIFAQAHGSAQVTYHTPFDTPAAVQDRTLEASAQLLWVLLEPLATATEGRYGVTPP